CARSHYGYDPAWFAYW
nr:immunoglobulin heavy chain junction region [Mus musculus]